MPRRRSPICPLLHAFLVFLVAVLAPRLAWAVSCAVPSDCYGVGEVCNAGICLPCEANFGQGLLACDNANAKVCAMPDGSTGGTCVQCVKASDCAATDMCDTSTNLCVTADGGPLDAGPSDGAVRDSGGGEKDGSALDGSSRDGSVPDGAPGDGAHATDGSSAADGSAHRDGAIGDGAARDGGNRDAEPKKDAAIVYDSASRDGQSSDGATARNPGGFVEGGGWSCAVGSGSAPLGGALFGLLLGLAALVRRSGR